MGGGSSKNVNKQNQVEEVSEKIEKATSKVVAGKENVIAVKADVNSSSEMLAEAQKALEQMDSLTDEHIKSISSLNNEMSWETQLEADQNMSTKEYEASLLIQTFLRQVLARKKLTRKVSWKNMNQLELFLSAMQPNTLDSTKKYIRPELRIAVYPRPNNPGNPPTFHFQRLTQKTALTTTANLALRRP